MHLRAMGKEEVPLNGRVMTPVDKIVGLEGKRSECGVGWWFPDEMVLRRGGKDAVTFSVNLYTYMGCQYSIPILSLIVPGRCHGYRCRLLRVSSSVCKQ